MTVLASVSTELTDADRLAFASLFNSEIGHLYPFSSAHTATATLDAHGEDIDRRGYFTRRKRIWKAISQNGELLGFTVATEKLGGSVKFGPTIIVPAIRNKGVGSELRVEVERRYFSQGFRKAYSTTNVRNIAGIYYLVRIGYKIEIHLENHYELGKGELVLSKFSPIDALPGRKYLEKRKFNGTALEYAIATELRKEFDEIDDAFLARLRNTLAGDLGSREADFIQKLKKIIRVGDHSLAVTVPKRGGCVKLLPLILSNSSQENKDLIANIVEYYGDRAHKLYTFVSLHRLEKANELKSLGFKSEGLLLEPYRKGSDMMVLSYFF